MITEPTLQDRAHKAIIHEELSLKDGIIKYKNRWVVNPKKAVEIYTTYATGAGTTPEEFIEVIDDLLQKQVVKDSETLIPSLAIMDDHTARTLFPWLQLTEDEDGLKRYVICSNPRGINDPLTDTTIYNTKFYLVPQSTVEGVIESLLLNRRNGDRYNMLTFLKLLLNTYWDESISFYHMFKKSGKAYIPEPEEFLKQVWYLLQGSKEMLNLVLDIVPYANDEKIPAYRHVTMYDLYTKYIVPVENILPATPHMHEWLYAIFRPDQVDMFKAYLWSLFDAGYSGHHSLHFYDRQGNTGKSTFVKAFKKYVNTLCPQLIATVNQKMKEDRFTYATLEHRLIGIVAELTNKHFLNSTLFHASQDFVSIEHKNKGSYSGTLYIRWLLFGNVAPAVNITNIHELRRIIFLKTKDTDINYLKKYCNLDSQGEPVKRADGVWSFIDPKAFQSNMELEMPAFIASCYSSYWNLTNGGKEALHVHENIAKDLEYSTSNTEIIKFAKFLHDNYEITGISADYVAAEDIIESISGDYGVKGEDQKFVYDHFLKYLLNTQEGLEQNSVVVDGRSFTAITGIKEK